MHTPPSPASSDVTNQTGFKAVLDRVTDKPLMRWLRQRMLVLTTMTLVATVSFLALSQSTAPNIPLVNLSADPLYATATGDKPVLALALSVEYPTVGAQYVDPDNNNSGTSDDVTYSSDREYLGYYDAESCYTYDDAGTGAPSGQTAAYKRFVRRGPAIALSVPNTTQPTKTTRMCWNNSTSYTKDDGTTPASSSTTNDAFSGNFLNWASSSAIDMLRLSLTGGDRVIDTGTLTVLQRAMIPDGDPISMGNSSNFPAKLLYNNGTSRAITSATAASPSFASGVNYFGAVPSSMATAAAGSNIYIANTLNRIYFGTTKSGNNSGGFGSYNLGMTTSYQIGPITSSNAPLQGNVSYQIGTVSSSSSSRPTSTYCADKDGTCTLPSGTWEVWYGKNGGSSWKVAAATGAVPCTQALFGNPTGSPEQCYYKAYSGSWTPTLVDTICASENGTCTLPSGTWQIRYGDGTSWNMAPATGAVPCTNSLWGDPISGTSKNCYYRAYSGTWTPTATTTTGLNSDGYFFARVQVCDRNPTTYALKDVRDYGLCKRYSDGAASNPQPNYKPTGAIQKYSDQLRLAAFGYLLDQTDSNATGGRYGGVLRAPIKYVGAKTFDINGIDNTISGGNPKAEWNAVTGVFNLNPEGNSTVACDAGSECSASYLSGVVNYVNQFGRTGSVRGRYKKYDPVGELHYEALRYLQGLPPSANAISNITTDMYDGFPVATTWTDPYGDSRSSTADYSCLKSNIVVIGDINTHDGNRLPTANAGNNIPDISAWRTTVRNFENNTSSTYLDGQGVSRTTGNPNGANGSAPSGTSTSQILGSAYWAHTHDIRGTGWTNATTAGTAGTALQRPGLRVKTFTFDVNEYGGSNVATTRRSSNQLFMAAKYGGFEADPSNPTKNPFNTKGNPFYRDNMTTADNYVWADTDTRTSRAGEANTYFLQSDARGVLSAFDDIFSRASTAARSIAGGAIQSKNLTQAGDTIYQGTFDTSDWSGDLLAIPVTVSSSNVVAISSTTNWTASTQLLAMATPATSRNIVVGKVSVPSGATTAATAFTWADIESNLSSDLDKTSPTATADGLAQYRLNYLRGDRAKEGNPFRSRTKLLGDIINSGVVYSGAPKTYINSSSFAAFYTANTATTGINAHAARTPAVFVGANDGMLHAFNATTGNELFAYIPSWMGPKLSALTNANYVNAHQSYVDGTPAVVDAQLGSAGTAADWKTVLVSGTGGGGQGVFALDVTDPTAFSASKVMWEFTHADDVDMGNVTGRPEILKLRTSVYNATTPTYKWFAVVGSGVNNYATASAGVFSAGNPALFLLALDKPIGTAWSLGSNYYKISLPIDSTLSASKATGLINFRASLNSDGAVSQIFMGDLHGNLWKLDFSLLGSADWNINKLSSFNKGTLANPLPYPLFIAKDSSGNVQPITSAPRIAFGPNTDASYILFGTGKYLETSDKSSTAQQSVYMVYDNGSTSGDSSPVGASAISGRARLRAGTANASTGTIAVPAFTLGRASSNTDTGTLVTTVRSGWYVDFATSGERQISSATVFGNYLIFGSLIPGASGGTGSCSASGGGGNQYIVNIATGNGTFVSSSVGIMGEPLVAEISSATTITASDPTGKRRKTIRSQIIQQGSGGIGIDGTSGTQTLTVIAGRLSWRQINNYQDLK
ncbi:MAG: PilC/PilY family type IV pilus protein [Pseudomonadota bacterium]